MAIISAGCQAGRAQPKLLIEEPILLQTGQAVRVEANRGKVIVTGSDSDALTISGQIVDVNRTQYRTQQSPDLVLISAETEQPRFSTSDEYPIELEIQAPQGISITLVTFDGLVSLRNIQGQVRVDSVAADIEAEGLQGMIFLRSGRGNVTCKGCSGETRLIGEHGVLTIEDSHGQIGSSTIMGRIHFTGQLLSDDSLHIEVDHGPVRVDALAGSSATVSAQSTSGVVVCPPRFDQTSRVCTGNLGQGEGSVYIRTVSGAITLQEQP